MMLLMSLKLEELDNSNGVSKRDIVEI